VSLVYGTDGHRAAIRDLDVRAWGGEVTGSASVVPHEHMRVDLQFRDVQAGQFVDAFGGFPIDVSARTSGQLQAYVPSDRIQDISAWKANGELNLLELSAAGVAASAQGRWELANGLVQFSQATLQVAGTPVSFSGQVRATPPYAFTSAVEARDGDLQQWQRLTPLTGRFTALRGRFSTAANVRGQLQPLHVQGSGQFSARDVGIEHLHIDQLAFSYALDRQRVTLHQIASRLYNGQASGDAVVPLNRQDIGQLRLSWAELQMGDLLAATGWLPFDLRGQTRGRLDLRVPAESMLQPASWDGEGNVTVEAASLLAWHGVRTTADWRLRSGQLTVRSLRLTADDGTRLAASGAAAVGTPFRYSAAVTLRNAELGKLGRLIARHRAPPDAAGRISLSGTVRGTLQPFTVASEGRVEGDHLRWAASWDELPPLRRLSGRNSFDSAPPAVVVAMDRAAFQYELSERQLNVSRLDARLY
jgi:hypothetical protein